MAAVDKLVTLLRERFGDVIADSHVHCGQITLVIGAEAIHGVCLNLCNDQDLAFEQLMDLSGVDYATFGRGDWQTRDTSSTGFSRGRGAVHAEKDSGPKLAVVYQLLSVKHNHRLRLKVFVESDPPRIQSLVDIWASADWYEREVFDLFGILFEGHPDLRRILTDYGFIGHPFRKDFPLEGNVEVRYDPDKRRVVYQPVTIENRVLVPRVIRDDNRYLGSESDR